MSLFPIYSLAVWTLGAPMIVGVVEWFVTRRQRSGLTNLRDNAGYAG